MYRSNSQPDQVSCVMALWTCDVETMGTAGESQVITQLKRLSLTIIVNIKFTFYTLSIGDTKTVN